MLVWVSFSSWKDAFSSFSSMEKCILDLLQDSDCKADGIHTFYKALYMYNKYLSETLSEQL